VCHLRNDVAARFCRGCGLPLGAPRDPVRGTTTRRADLPSDRGAGIAAILSLVAIVAIAGLAGFLVLRGFESTTTAGASASSSSPPVAAVASGDPGTSAAPVASQDPGPRVASPTEPIGQPTPEPTEEPTEVPTEGPTARPLATRTGWTCKNAAIQDPLRGRWRIAQARWGRTEDFDRLTFDLTRVDGEAQRGVIVRMQFLRPNQAASRYEVERPDGDRAIVLTFDGAMNLRNDIALQRPGLVTLASVETREDDEGTVRAVVGVNGDGCVRLVANEWRNGSDDTTEAKLVLDIRR
jgi:hypothetical protein